MSGITNARNIFYFILKAYGAIKCMDMADERTLLMIRNHPECTVWIIAGIKNKAGVK